MNGMLYGLTVETLEQEGVWKLSSGELVSASLGWDAGQNYLKNPLDKLISF